MARFAVTGMVLVLLMALMVISLSGIDSQDKITGFVAVEKAGSAVGLPSTYSVVPISRLSLNYTLSEYTRLVTEAKRLVVKCASRDNVTDCLDIYLKKGWSIAGNEGNIYKFDVAASQKLPMYDEAEQKIVEKELTYRLALDFS
jgi:hypothetical protein